MFSNFCPLTDLNNLTNTLDNYGVAVLPNVLTEQECDTLKTTVFQKLANEHSVINPSDFRRLSPISGGILHYYGVSLTKEVLDMKTDDRVIEPFKRIWNENELTTSLDGMNIVPPPQIEFLGNATGFHLDQGPHRNGGLCCVQAFVNLEHTEDGDGCLSVLRNSHKFSQEFYIRFNIDTKGRDWFLLNKTSHLDWFRHKGCEWNKILAPKGSMVFWDSRTVHMATSPVVSRPNPDRWRFVIYVCYTPARWQTEEDARNKKTAYVQNKCTSHWPYGVTVFKKASDDIKKNNLHDLSEKHKKCLGIY